jgi:hypothetical protein
VGFKVKVLRLRFRMKKRKMQRIELHDQRGCAQMTEEGLGFRVHEHTMTEGGLGFRV